MGVKRWEVSRAAYTRDVLIEIAKKYEFDVDEANFEWWVQKAAARYLKGIKESREPDYRREKIKDLKKVIQHSQRLLDMYNVDQKYLFLGLDDIAERKGIRGPKFTKEELKDPFVGFGWHDDQYIKYIELGRDHAFEELEFLKKHKGGRPALEGHYAFSRYLADFWERILKRRFTFDHVNKTGLTESYCFVRDCLAYLEPVDETKLVSALRRVTTEMRDYINRPSK